MIYWGIFLCGIVTFYWIINWLWHGTDIFSLLLHITDYNAGTMKFIPVTLLQKVSESLVGIGIATIDFLSFEVSDLDHFLLV